MTVEKMKEDIENYCNKLWDEGETCNSCPLFIFSEDRHCYDGDDLDEIYEENYRILFGETEPDNVNHPAHYETGKFECIDVMVETQGKEAVKAYCLCAAFKYLYRHKRKNGLEDIKKARWYLDKFIELEGENHD